jgi:hypothetical protein
MKKKKRSKIVSMKDFLDLKFPRNPKQKKFLLLNGELWEITAQGSWSVPEFQ